MIPNTKNKVVTETEGSSSQMLPLVHLSSLDAFV